ncbi:putative RNA-directed DNA polymerase [Helianthus annuus]|nr:putative RNA-directed DNA polymerase [Helianthus annuus]
MQLALMAKNKLGFIDGSCKRSTTDDVLASQWDRCNSIVLTWILNSIADELYVGQVYSKLASEVWDDLKETYNKIDGSVVFGLFQKINSVSQNGTSVSEYYHKINTMWKQFDAMLQLPSCTCHASTKFNEFNHLIKLMQFLMGLDDVYQPVRTNLLTRDPLPTVKTAFSIISREESHRDSNSSSKVPNVGFAAKTNQFNENKKRFTKGSNPNLKCTHCNKIGHVVDKCFELHGYPSNFRPRPNQNNTQWSKPNISANSSINSSGNPSVSDKSASNSLISLTSDQFTKLLDLLNEKRSDDGPKTNVGGKCHNVISSLDCYKKSYCFNSKSWSQNNMSWIIDSGANQHMIMSSENMFNKVDVSDYNITVKHPNGTDAKVTIIGCYKLSNSVILKDVFVVPEYCVNLISVHKLAKDNKLRVVFDEDTCYIQDSYLKKTLVTGRQTDGLYFCGNSFNSVIACFNKAETIKLWHSRLGHPADQALNVLNLKDDKTNTEPCEVCHKAKQHRVPFPLSEHKTSKVGDLIHLDVWGPYKVSSIEGFKYFLTVVDDYSRSVWVYLMKSKTEVFENIQSFYNLVKTQFEVNIKVFRSDNGTEFVNSQMSNFVKSHGIIHQTSCAYTPQQNGVVERKHRHLLNVARALLFQSGVPLKFWSECVLTASYLINRTPSSVLNGKTPYELLFRFEPSLSHLKIFGCLCFFTVLNNPDKLDERAEKCIFMGYSNLKKGYKVWSLDQKKFTFSRDVSFHENVFPYKTKQFSKSDLDNTELLNNSNFFDLYDSSSDINPDDDEKAETDSATVTQQHSSSSESTHPVDTQQPSSGDGMAGNQQVCEPEPNTVRAESSDSNEESNLPEGTHTTTRKSTRSVYIPKKFGDYVVEGKVKFGYERVVNYANLPPDNVCFASNVNKILEPSSYQEAIKDSNWVNAMNEELSALHENNTWSIVDLPKGRKPVGCKWVFRVKYKSNGEVERYKARLVAKGFNQREGIDFDETFSPVVKMVTIRCIVSLSVQNDWPLYQLDVNNAFLYGNLKEEVYMSMPEGLNVNHSNKVCKLNRSLYGLKQAPRMWNEKLVHVLLKMGFYQSKCDHSMFIKSDETAFVVMLVYVDDIILTGNSKQEIDNVKNLLQSEFKIKDLGLLKFFLGIEVLSRYDSFFP